MFFGVGGNKHKKSEPESEVEEGDLTLIYTANIQTGLYRKSDTEQMSWMFDVKFSYRIEKKGKEVKPRLFDDYPAAMPPWVDGSRMLLAVWLQEFNKAISGYETQADAFAGALSYFYDVKDLYDLMKTESTISTVKFGG